MAVAVSSSVLQDIFWRVLMCILFAKRLRQLSLVMRDLPSVSSRPPSSLRDRKSQSDFSSQKESRTGESMGGSNQSSRIRSKKTTKKPDDDMFKLSLKITVLTFIPPFSVLFVTFLIAMGLHTHIIAPLDLSVNGACIFLGFSFSKNYYDKVCWICSRVCKSLYARKIAKKKKKTGNNEDVEKDMGEAIDIGDVEKGKAVE